jgi:acyl carrier protein
MSNHEKLEDLVIDVFLLEPEEFHHDLRRDEVDTWDSLGIVSMAVGIQDVFGYHFTPDEATSVDSIKAIISLLEQNGISFDE